MIDKMLRAETLTANEEIINNYCLNNLNKIAYMTIYDLSKATFISTSGIVRYCKKLGAVGFKDFKMKLIDSQINQFNSPINDIISIQNKELSIVDITKEINLANIDALNLLTKTLSESTLDRIATMFLNANNIYGIGVGVSHLKLRELHLKLLKIGIQIHLTNYQSEQFYLAKFSRKNDLCIIISYSGETAEIVNDCKILKRNSTPIISITANSNSILSENSDVVLEIPSFEELNEIESSIVADNIITSLINIIYISIIKKLNIQDLTPTPISNFQ